jgi:hypothetical protein
MNVAHFSEKVNSEGLYWECPHCRHYARIQSEDISSTFVRIPSKSKTTVLEVLCPNPECQETSIYYTKYVVEKHGSVAKESEMLFPHGVYKHYPDYVPEPIRRDYEEAAIISQLSPKASAALIRRALQGIIKHKWPHLKNKKLYDQINSLEGVIKTHEFAALHGIRKIGNVSVHMENPGVIADQDSPITTSDAEKLIELLEYLIKVWIIEVEESKALMSGISDRGDEIDRIQKGE